MASPPAFYDDLLLFAISWVKEHLEIDSAEVPAYVAVVVEMLERELPAVATLMESQEDFLRSKAAPAARRESQEIAAA